jgi:hypothetical protein
MQETQVAYQQGVEEARSRAFAHPFTEAHRRVERITVDLQEVFIPNASELHELLAAAATDFTLAIELVQNVRRSLVAEQFHAQLAQRLHNYFAAAYTLSEHAKRISDLRKKQHRRTTDPLASPWAEKQAELLGSPEVEFARQLRTYVQHIAGMPITTNLSMDNLNTPEQSFKSEIQLEVSSLRREFKWTGGADTFLGKKDSVELRPVIDTYTSRLVALYRWLIQQLIADAEPLRAEHEELVIAANAALTGADRETARSMTDEITERRSSVEEPPWA